MTSKQLLLDLLAGKKTGRIPFVPAIYEHKAALINKTPSEVCLNPGLLYESLLAEYETYKPDLLTVGIDVYNIEPEALGSKIRYENGNEVPTIENPVLTVKNPEDLQIPNPEKDGRMPIIIEAAKKIYARLGNEVHIAVGISAPFSLMGGLLGQENMLMKSIEEPEYIIRLSEFCTEVQKSYISAILKTGAEVVLFDSAAAPPMVSPGMYEEFVLPYVKQIFDFLRLKEVRLLSYIVGGNTIPILNHILSTGANNVLCDFNADLDYYLNAVRNTNISLRKNISPSDILNKSSEELGSVISGLVNKGKEFNGFILGTGILPYNTPPEKIKAIKEYI